MKHCPTYYCLALYPTQSHHYVYESHRCPFLHLMCHTRFYSHRKQQNNLRLLYFNHLILLYSANSCYLHSIPTPRHC